MAKSNLNSELLKLAHELLKSLNSRQAEVLKRRYGLGTFEPQTLEAIGKIYKITRERVRQIENSAFKSLKNLDNKPKEFFAFVDGVYELLEAQGGLMALEKLEKILSEKYPQISTYQINFFLRIDDRFNLVKDSNHFREFWSLKKVDTSKVINLLEKIEQELLKKGEVKKLEELCDWAKKYYPSINPEILENFLFLDKQIASNPFKEYGLRHWELIEPRGAREKAYLIMKHLKKPLHFREVARLINDRSTYLGKVADISIWQREIQPQTVHNELIKDKRFVLIGRGIYALADWGYQPGTVKDIIIKILKQSKKPLSKEEIIEKVKQQRLVKDNTIILNLSNRKLFKKNGRYYQLARR
jgi:hypothetical protein